MFYNDAHNSLLAESEGFEPSKAFTLPLFESGTFNLSDNSPRRNSHYWQIV